MAFADIAREDDEGVTLAGDGPFAGDGKFEPVRAVREFEGDLLAVRAAVFRRFIYGRKQGVGCGTGEYVVDQLTNKLFSMAGQQLVVLCGNAQVAAAAVKFEKNVGDGLQGGLQIIGQNAQRPPEAATQGAYQDNADSHQAHHEQGNQHAPLANGRGTRGFGQADLDGALHGMIEASQVGQGDFAQALPLIGDGARVRRLGAHDFQIAGLYFRRQALIILRGIAVREDAPVCTGNQQITDVWMPLVNFLKQQAGLIFTGETDAADGFGKDASQQGGQFFLLLVDHPLQQEIAGQEHHGHQDQNDGPESQGQTAVEIAKLQGAEGWGAADLAHGVFCGRLFQYGCDDGQLLRKRAGIGPCQPG